MHALTIIIGQNHSVIWNMMFTSVERAEAARRNFMDDTSIYPVEVTDDFGQRINVKRDQIVAVMLEDLSLSKLAHVEQAIHRAHIQSDAQQRAESDPKLRIARSMQGPGMFSPMNGRM